MSEIPPEKTCRLALHPAENVYIHRFRRKYTFFHKARKIAGLLLFLFSFLRCLSSPPFLFTHLRAGFMWRFLRRERGVFGFWRQSGTFPPFFTVSFRREIPIRFPGVPDGVFPPDPSRKRVFCPPKNGSFCHRKHVLQTRKRKCPAQQNARNHK